MTTSRALGSSGESTESSSADLNEIEKFLAHDNRFFCETYHCHMRIAACIARQKNAETMRGKGRPIGRYFKPGAGDINCQNCKQGKGMAESRRQMTDNRKQREEMQICKDEKCESSGVPQPMDAFQIHGPSGKPLEICRKCMGRRKSEGHQKKKQERKNGPTKSPVDKKEKTPGEQVAHSTGKGEQTEESENKYTLTIDFSKHQDVLERLKKVAEDECRKPKMQVLYILKRLYKKGMNSEVPREQS